MPNDSISIEKQRVEHDRWATDKLLELLHVHHAPIAPVIPPVADADDVVSELFVPEEPEPVRQRPIHNQLLVVANELLGVQQLKRFTTAQPSIAEIQQATCRHFQISKNDLLSNRRTLKVVIPRQVAMYVCKQQTTRSLPEIGRHFGKRDHTTVLHAVRKVEKYFAAFQTHVDEITKAVQ